MKFILIKAGEKAEVVELSGDTIDYLKMKEYLQIDSPVTCVERKIGNEYYDLWLDDEGLLKAEETRVLGGILCCDLEHRDAHEILVGNILILRHDEEGNSIGLTDEDIEEIMKPMHITNTDDFQKFQGKPTDKDIVLYGYFDGGAITIKAHSQWLMYQL